MQEKTVNVSLGKLPEDKLQFNLTYDGVPAIGASFTLVTKGVIPLTFSKTSDANGIIVFDVKELVPAIGEAIFNKIPWLTVAYIDGTEFGYWKDQVFYELGNTYNIKLKKYEKAPTFFIKIELREVIGLELFSNLVTEIEKAALNTAGLEIVKIKGQGTKNIEVQFKPPWHSSPLVIEWASVWFILKVMAVAAAIIAVLVVAKWSFGEVGAGIAGGIGLAVLILILLSATKKGGGR